MMKRLLTLLLALAFAGTGFSQGVWRLIPEKNYYTQETEFIPGHYTTKGQLDAVFYPTGKTLKVIREYKGPNYLNIYRDAIMHNNGRIPSSERRISTLLMQSGFSKEKTVSAAIYYRGMGDDGEIDSQGFSSFFYASYSGEELKKADYVTFDYFDKALGKKESFKLSLAGFSACLSEFEAETRKKEEQPIRKEEEVMDNSIVEVQAAYPGGESALLRFISENLILPRSTQEGGVQGIVVLRFRIEIDGSVGKVVIKKGLSKECDQAAIDVVRKLHLFTPARQQGHPVPVWFTLPIRFQSKTD